MANLQLPLLKSSTEHSLVSLTKFLIFSDLYDKNKRGAQALLFYMKKPLADNKWQILCFQNCFCYNKVMRVGDFYIAYIAFDKVYIVTFEQINLTAVGEDIFLFIAKTLI